MSYRNARSRADLNPPTDADGRLLRPGDWFEVRWGSESLVEGLGRYWPCEYEIIPGSLMPLRKDADAHPFVDGFRGEPEKVDPFRRWQFVDSSGARVTHLERLTEEHDRFVTLLLAHDEPAIRELGLEATALLWRAS